MSDGRDRRRTGLPASRTETPPPAAAPRRRGPKKPSRVAVRSRSGAAVAGPMPPTGCPPTSRRMPCCRASRPRWQSRPRRAESRLGPCTGLRSTQRPSGRAGRGATAGRSSRDQRLERVAAARTTASEVTAAPRSESTKQPRRARRRSPARCSSVRRDELQPGEGAESPAPRATSPAVGEREVAGRPARAAATPRCGASRTGLMHRPDRARTPSKRTRARPRARRRRRTAPGCSRRPVRRRARAASSRSGRAATDPATIPRSQRESRTDWNPRGTSTRPRLVQPRLPPQERQRDERDEQGRAGPDDERGRTGGGGRCGCRRRGPAPRPTGPRAGMPRVRPRGRSPSGRRR